MNPTDHGSDSDMSVGMENRSGQFRTGSVSETPEKRKNVLRRLTGGSLYQVRHRDQGKLAENSQPQSSPKRNVDPIHTLLGMGVDLDKLAEESLDQTHSNVARARRAKRYMRSAPAGFATENYSTALGPLQEKHKLNPLERVFLESAERGDKSTLARCLSFKDKVNVNCVNMLGRTAIQIAVDNENIELVELLLQQPGIKIGDALLYAIQEGVYRIVEMLIDHPSITKEMLGSSWRESGECSTAGEEESHDFSADISPVILAAVCNQFEILQLLLNRGARIEEPHKSSCDCARCFRLLAEDPLKHTLQRINTYRALASPAWISLTSPDPILTAFELSSELLHLASRENEFKETFISLCEQCRKYACDLLDLCRGTGEVVAVLGKSNNSESESSSDSDEEIEDPCKLHGHIGEANSTIHEGAAASVGERWDQANRLDPNDWRSLVNRSNGSRRRHLGWTRHENGAHFSQGQSIESQHTVVDDLNDDGNLSVANFTVSNKGQEGVKPTLLKKAFLTPPGPQTHVSDYSDKPGSEEVKEHTHGELSRKLEIVVPTPEFYEACPTIPNRTDSNSDDGVMSSFSGAQLGRSNLFSQPRKVSFDHEVELSRKKANANSTITSKAVCCGCRRKPRRLTKTPSDPEKNEETGSATKEPTVIYSFKLDRLKLAIKHEQKKFVAHPHCQHLLTTLWYDQLPGWRKRHPCTKVFLCFCFIIAMPILAPVYLLHPRGRVGLVLRSPLIKFINHSASFAIFIILLLIASTDSSTDQYLNDRSAIRGPNPNSIELLILWWVMGFVWSEMKQIWEEGFKAYVRQWWNWLDFVMLGLYLTTVALRLVALWLRLTDAYGTEPTPRTEWPADDPTLLSEALFSIAHIFSFARIIFLFQVNEHLGPLQISLGNMLIDITKFIFIFLLVISSFACGLHQLYYYYVSSEGDFRPDAFKSLVRSYRTLFWNLFGNSQPDHFKVRILNETTGKREDLPSARSTVIVGEILLLIYHAMAIIVLINMLIAMMSNSFQTIQNHADTEWKFARSKLWVGYFDEGSTLPPPLNTIISPKSIFRAFAGVYHLFRYCFKRCSLGWHQSGPERHHVSVAWDDCDKRPCDSDLGKVWSSSGPSQTPDYHEGATNMDAHVLRRQTGTRPKPNRRQTFYQMVMCRLVRRYIHQSKKTMRQDGVNEDDLLEIKQDISSLRYELREDRKREVARTIGHLEGLKRDLLEEIAKQFGLVRQTDLLSNGYLRAEAQKPCDSKFREGASLPGSMVRSEIVEHRPVLQTSLKSEGVFEQVARPADQTKLAVPSLSPKSGQPTFSLSYSRDTQHMYDEIKQLALINSAYDANVSIDDRTIPPYTYMHLKQDILQGVRNELLELLQIPKRSDGEPTLSYPSTKKLDFSTQIKAAPVSPTLPCPSGKGTTVRRTSAQKQGSAPRQLIRQPRQSISPSDPEDGGLVHKTDVVAGTSTSTTHRASKPTEFEETWRREDR